MATMNICGTKDNAYGASSSSSDPYFAYHGVSQSLSGGLTLGNLTVTAITSASLSNANTNGNSSSGSYTMRIDVMYNGAWHTVGRITTTTKTSSHRTWSSFTSTASSGTLSALGKYPVTDMRGCVTAGYFHVNAGSQINLNCTVVEDYTDTTISLDTSSVEAGSTIQVNINQADDALTYDVVWQFGNSSQTNSLSAGVKFNAFQIPLDWLSEIPYALSGTATCTVYTYSQGSLKGTKTANFTISCPLTAVPTITQFVAYRIDNDVPASWNAYIERHSQAELHAYAEGVYGSSVTSYYINAGSWGASSNTLTTGVFQTAGTYTFSVTATDTRGRSGTATISIVVESYTQPTINETMAFRCDESGNTSQDGTYGAFQMKFAIDTRRGNEASTMIEYRPRASSTWLVLYTDLLTSGATVILNGGFESNTSYDIRFSLSDAVSTVYATDSISTAMYPMHLKANGKGVAFGKLAELENTMEVSSEWEFNVYGRRLADYIFPVGTVYTNNYGTNPASVFGGTWENIGSNSWLRTS